MIVTAEIKSKAAELEARILDVLRHRVIVTYEAEAESITTESVVEQIFAGVPVP